MISGSDARPLRVEVRPARIVAAQVARVELPLREPLRTSAGIWRSRTAVLVRLVDAEGRAGYGEATPLPEPAGGASARDDAALAEAEVRARVRDLVRVASPPSPAPLHARGERRPPAVRAFSPSSAFAVDLALLDLEAKRRGVPVAGLLADRPRAEVAVQALVSADGAAGAARSAERAVSAGFGTVKVKVGADPAADLQRLAAVRSAVGPSTVLRVDANGGWSVEQTLGLLDRLVDLGVELLEDPVQDPRDFGRLRGRGVAIAADLRALPGMPLVDDPALDVDAVVLKPGCLGPLGECLALARALHDRGIGVVVSSALDGAVARAGAAHLAAAVPAHRGAAGLGVGSLLARDVCPGLEVRSGFLHLDSGPGLGTEPVASLPWVEA